MEQANDQQGEILRSRLRQSAPALYAAFERSWTIAQGEWLQAIGPNLGSINSYTHLRNVENHLDQIVLRFETLQNTTFTERLSGFELYMLLSAVLFHDFGRTQRQTGTPGHGAQAQLEKKYVYLGIPSWEIARSLGKICAFHDPWKETKREDMAKNLHTTVIDPYGRTREAFLAALLTLADHMDGAFTRALPYYVAETDEIEAVGWFRRAVRGVYVDPDARLVRTVLVTNGQPAAQSNGSFRAAGREIYVGSSAGPVRTMSVADGGLASESVRRCAEVNEERNQDWRDLVNAAGGGWHNMVAKWQQYGLFHDVERLEELDEQLENLIASIPSEVNCDGVIRQLKTWHNARPAGLLRGCSVLHWFQALDLIRVKTMEDDHHKEKGRLTFPKTFPIAIVLGNVRESSEALDEIKELLANCGINLDAWVLERGGHLFSRRDREVFEPIFDKMYLKRTAKGMWKLSARIFGQSRFSYEDLGAEIGDPATERVRRSVRRISVVTDSEPLTTGAGRQADLPTYGAILAGDSHWQWQVARNESACAWVRLKRIEELIDKLERPNEPYG
jgi:hypothetical protein